MVNAQRTTIEVWKHVEGLRSTKKIAGVARGNRTNGKGAEKKPKGEGIGGLCCHPVKSG